MSQTPPDPEDDRARALLAAIVESSEDAIVSKSLDGTIRSWNRGAERIFGYTADQAIGRHITLIIPPERHSEEAAILARISRGQRIEHFETVRRTREGRLITVSLTVSPVRDDAGRITGASKIARDVTARRFADDMLRKQSQTLRLLWESAAVLLTAQESVAMMQALFTRIAPHLALDAYMYFSPTGTGDALELRSYAGLSEEQASRLARSDLSRSAYGIAAARRERIVAPHIQESRDPMFEPARRLGLRACVWSPLVAEGRLLGVLTFGSCRRDAFEQGELEFLQTISHYVTVACERARLLRELRDTDRRKDEFLATLAHELRNPLAPIRNALQIMALSDEGAAFEHARSMMERQLGQMVRLIDDLLDVSRITVGKLALRKERVALSSVLESAVETARPLIDASGHVLHVGGIADPVCVDADPVRLAQVFSNLLNNAAKYMDRGGRIDVATSRCGDEICVTVSDAGRGIPAEALARVFDMFSRVDHSLEPSHGGLGIGLTLVKRLVEMHGGRVEVSSEGLGTGTQVSVHLRAASASPSAEAATPRRCPRAARRDFRILVADDNRDAADSLAIMLRMMGNHVRTAHDGEQAVTEAAAFRPDVLLLDIGMPRMNGYDVAREIRAQGWGARMLLVALTGWGQDEDKRRASEAGFDRHFTKPMGPADLEKLLEELADGTRAQSDPPAQPSRPS